MHTHPYSGVWEDEEGWQFQLALRLGIHNAMATDGSAEGNLSGKVEWTLVALPDAAKEKFGCAQSFCM